MAPGAPWWELALAGFLSVVVGQFFFGPKKREPADSGSGSGAPGPAGGENGRKRRSDGIAK